MTKLFLIIFSLLLIFLSARGFNFDGMDLVNDESLSKLYERWKTHHLIERGEYEMDHRFNIFKDNVDYVYNTMTIPYNLKLNRFADFTFEEFSRTYGDCNSRDHNKKSESESARSMYENVTELPTTVDWRDSGAVAPVKDQGETCRSCWVFAAVAAVEGINQIFTRQPVVSLSEQEVVDCATINKGCDPGFLETAFQFIKNNGGITTENDYSYIDEVGICQSQTNKIENVGINGYEKVTQKDETALAAAVYGRPVSVSISYGDRRFMLYNGGVFSGPCGTETNHAMLAVGYGVDRFGTKYWILKNSYGTTWGDQGYMKMEKDVSDDNQGRCGITLDAWFPIKTAFLTSLSATKEDQDTKHDEL